jgi:phosphate uptake regulator
MSLSGIQDPRNILEYAMINKSMERAADHVVKIAYEVISLGDNYTLSVPPEVRARLSDLVEHDLSLMGSIGKSLNEGFNLKELNHLIDTVKHEIKSSVESLLSSLNKHTTDPSVLASLRLMLDSIVRIAEYASDVAESLINLTIEGTT